MAMSPQKRSLRLRGLKRGDDALHEVEVDGAKATSVNVGFGLAEAEVNGLVGAYVEEGAGEDVCEFGKHLGDEGDGAGLTGCEDIAVRGLGEGGVGLPGEIVVEVAEGLLLGDDVDVIETRIGDEGGGFSGREAAAGRSHEGVRGVLEGVLEVGRVDVDLVSGQGADELLLELEGREGAAGQVVGEATVLHGGPVANGGLVEDGVRVVALD